MTTQGPNNSSQYLRQITEIETNPNIKTTFSALGTNLEPFVLNRQLDSYKHIVAVIDVQTDNPLYNDVKDYIAKSVKNIPYASDKIIKEYSTSSTSKNFLYTIDLRKNKDNSLYGKLELPTVDSWIQNTYFNSIIENSRGIIVYCDNISDVPKCVSTRSIFALSDKIDKELKTFLVQTLGNSNYLNLSTKSDSISGLNGMIKSIHNTKLVCFNHDY